jgi:hypothetical protein
MGLSDGTPLCALVVVKMLNDAGEVIYQARTTDGLAAVEALGMAEFARVKLRELLTNSGEYADDE